MQMNPHGSVCSTTPVAGGIWACGLLEGACGGYCGHQNTRWCSQAGAGGGSVPVTHTDWVRIASGAGHRACQRIGDADGQDRRDRGAGEFHSDGQMVAAGDVLVELTDH